MGVRLKAGSLPKKVTKTMKEMLRIMNAMVVRVPILSDSHTSRLRPYASSMNYGVLCTVSASGVLRREQRCFNSRWACGIVPDASDENGSEMQKPTKQRDAWQGGGAAEKNETRLVANVRYCLKKINDAWPKRSGENENTRGQYRVPVTSLALGLETRRYPQSPGSQAAA